MRDGERPTPAWRGLTPYWLMGAAFLVLALLLRAPASLLQKALPAAAPLQVSAWGGSLWQGQAQLRHGEQSGFLRWQLLPVRLLRGQLAAQWQLQGLAALQGQLRLGPGGWRLQGVQGQLPEAAVRALLPAGWQLPGRLQVQAVQLARAGLGEGAWLAAGGQLQWDGGNLSYNLNGQSQQAHLPALRLNLRLEGEVLLLALAEQDSGAGLALLRISPNGEVETRLRERLLRYTPTYRSSGADPDAVVVTSRQRW